LRHDLRGDDADVTVLAADAIAAQSIDEDGGGVGSRGDLFLDGRGVEGAAPVIHDRPAVLRPSFVMTPIDGASFRNSPDLLRPTPQVVSDFRHSPYMWCSRRVCM